MALRTRNTIVNNSEVAAEHLQKALSLSETFKLPCYVNLEVFARSLHRWTLEDIQQLVDFVYEMKVLEGEKCSEWYLGKFFNSEEILAIPRYPQKV